MWRCKEEYNQDKQEKQPRWGEVCLFISLALTLSLTSCSSFGSSAWRRPSRVPNPGPRSLLMSEPGLGYITETPWQHEPIDQVHPSEFHYHRLLAAPSFSAWVSMGFFSPSPEEMRTENKVLKGRKKRAENGDGWILHSSNVMHRSEEGFLIPHLQKHLWVKRFNVIQDIFGCINTFPPSSSWSFGSSSLLWLNDRLFFGLECTGRC